MRWLFAWHLARDDPGLTMRIDTAYALFKPDENRFIDTDHIADIQYTPANSMTVGEPKPSQRTPSYLNIKMKSSEEIRLQGDEADEVWAAYQKANCRPTR